MKRAALVSKQPTKKSKIVVDTTGGAAEDSLDGFTKRLLMSMVFDVSQLEKTVERIKVQVFTAAKAHGIVPPEKADD